MGFSQGAPVRTLLFLFFDGWELGGVGRWDGGEGVLMMQL